MKCGWYSGKVLKLNEKIWKSAVSIQRYLNNEQEQSTKKTEKNSNPKKEEKMETSTKQSTNEQTNDFTPFDTNRIPESEYQKYGIKPENLEGELKAMSYGYKSPHLVDINPNIDGVDYPMKARLSFRGTAGRKSEIYSASIPTTSWFG